MATMKIFTFFVFVIACILAIQAAETEKEVGNRQKKFAWPFGYGVYPAAAAYHAPIATAYHAPIAAYHTPYTSYAAPLYGGYSGYAGYGYGAHAPYLY